MRWVWLLRAVPVLLVVSAVTGCDTTLLKHKQSDLETENFLLIGEPDFNWFLSGDRRVAPLQVFSDPWRVWLQWHDGQPIPTVFVMESGQWQIARLLQHGKFSVIEGQWRELRFQGGRLRADANYGQSARMASTAPIVETTVQQVSHSVSTEKLSGSVHKTSSAKYSVMLADQTIRQVLARWAAEQQWHFSNSHWAVSVDIPVTAQAAFHGEFVEAVRALLASTDIAGRALQPCFYTNRVLRVISANESCDPTTQAGARS